LIFFKQTTYSPENTKRPYPEKKRRFDNLFFYDRLIQIFSGKWPWNFMNNMNLRTKFILMEGSKGERRMK
jgi:hypothetical protein